MTRRGVHRWAARAFCRGVIVHVLRSPNGKCCVELWLPTSFGSRVVRWTDGESWGACVRALEDNFLFQEAPRDEWCFQSQLLVHERKDELTLRVLGGARLPKSPQTIMSELSEIGRYPVI